MKSSIWVTVGRNGREYHMQEQQKWFERFDGISDPESFIRHIRAYDRIPYEELERERYEALCSEWGIQPVDDSEMGDYGDCYGHWFMYHYFADPNNRRYGVERTLRQRRWWAVKKLVPVLVPVPPVAEAVRQQAWGSGGIRYDEHCDQCGRETEVDNNTGICRKCRG